MELLEPRLNFSPIFPKDQDLARIISALETGEKSNTSSGSLPLEAELVTWFLWLKLIGDVTGRKCASYELAQHGLQKKGGPFLLYRESGELISCSERSAMVEGVMGVVLRQGCGTREKEKEVFYTQCFILSLLQPIVTIPIFKGKNVKFGVVLQFALACPSSQLVSGGADPWT